MNINWKKAVAGLLALSPLITMGQFDPIQGEEAYKVQVDLTAIEDDRVKVEYVVPIVRAKEVIYNMPSMVPGTYKVYNFGRFVNDLVAIGGRGDTLDVERLNTNQWKISEANKLYKIVYWADDTYDEKGEDIFAPAGTNFSDDVNLLNIFSFVGYLDGYKHLGFEFEVIKPSGHFSSTSLEKINSSEEKDVFKAEDYFELHDCPILVAKADTASVDVAGTEISIGVYSPKKNLEAKTVMREVEPIFHAAAEYLGGNLPADKYTILLYGMDLKQSMLGIGALEHHTSTVVNVPDISDQYMRMLTDESMMQLLRDIISHEFFHIVTPLNIHSQHIADYDFMNPQMSKHLWLYEGITEYNANASQARAGILSEEQFFENMKAKMKNSYSFNEDIPFTVASQFALNYFEDQYLNVYEKGALIGMCLDLKLLKETDGEYGLPELLMELSMTYGKDTFFVDDELFDIMTKQAKVEGLREFFARYVEGAEPLPYTELFEAAGYDFEVERITKTISDAGIELKEEGNDIVIVDYRKDGFQRDLGIMRRDVLLEWNGTKVTAQNYNELLMQFVSEAKVGESVEVLVKRKINGKAKKVRLNGIVQHYVTKEKDVLEKQENPDAKQLRLRKAWINY